MWGGEQVEKKECGRIDRYVASVRWLVRVAIWTTGWEFSTANRIRLIS